MNAPAYKLDLPTTRLTRPDSTLTKVDGRDNRLEDEGRKALIAASSRYERVVNHKHDIFLSILTRTRARSLSLSLSLYPYSLRT
jgi:hypothetical protein